MQSYATEVVTLATAQGLPFWWAQGVCSRGIALAQQGDIVEGISQIHQGLATCRALGATVGISRVLGWLAEAYGQAGQIDEGVRVLEEAFAVVEHSDERIWEAELYKRKGELTLQRFKSSLEQATVHSPESSLFRTQAEAEACFLKAIEVARRQQAKSWELRAAVSLGQLWQAHGKIPEARELLEDIYGWFTEGFDTKDLQEAKALVEKNCKE